jgi:hypothetical protein
VGGGEGGGGGEGADGEEGGDGGSFHFIGGRLK